MTLELVRHRRARDLLDRAGAFLVAREAENNLLLGLCAVLETNPTLYDGPPYLATVEDGGEIVAVALRTPPHKLVVSSTSQPAVEQIALDALAEYGALPGVLGPSATSQAFAATWERLTGHRKGEVVAERIYQIEKVSPVSGVSGAMRVATRAERDLLIEWLVDFADEALGDADRAQITRSVDLRLAGTEPIHHLWIDGEPVSLAVASGPTPNGIRIGPVYTPPEHRNRGYASACVATLSQTHLDRGKRFCFLFTNLANPTSNAIYQKIGYQPVCNVDQIQFL